MTDHPDILGDTRRMPGPRCMDKKARLAAGFVCLALGAVKSASVARSAPTRQHRDRLSRPASQLTTARYLLVSWAWLLRILDTTSAPNGYSSPSPRSGCCLHWPLGWPDRDAPMVAGWTRTAATTIGRMGATTAIEHRLPRKLPRRASHHQIHSLRRARHHARSRPEDGRSETAPKPVQQGERPSEEASQATGLTSTGITMELPVSRTRDGELRSKRVCRQG